VKGRHKQDLDKRGYPNYGRALVAGLKKSRKGKHHDLLSKIMEDLRESAPGFAVRIPLSATAPTPVVNLRAAIVRTAAKEGIAVSTSSDNDNFYVWKAGNRV
jgi:hypothetical protein